MTKHPYETDDPQYSRRGAIAVVVRRGELLVIRRSEHVIAPGKLCFPGGGIEGDETEQDALIRECREEIGVDVTPLARIWENVTPWNIHLAWWRADVPDDVRFTLDAREVAEVRWMTLEDLLADEDVLESNLPFLHGVQRGEILL